MIHHFVKILFALALGMAATAHADDQQKAREALAVSLGANVENIQPTPMAGLYEVRAGTQILYISEDGKYVLTGHLFNYATRENLTDTRLKGIRHELMGLIPEEQMITFKAKDPKHTITVFTDIDCAYCRKLHSEIQQYNDLGISVRYLFYPRAGLGSSSHLQAVSVWCDKDRNDALTRAKGGETLPERDCKNPVNKHFALGREIDITGTPAILTEDGGLYPGYVPAQQLIQRLEMDRQGLAATGG